MIKKTRGSWKDPNEFGNVKVNIQKLDSKVDDLWSLTARKTENARS